MSGNNGAGPGVVVPGQIKFGVAFQNTPNAVPGFVTINHRDGYQTIVLGGLAKLEHAAIEIAKSQPELSPVEAVERALGVLNACQRPEPEPTPEADDEPPSSPLVGM